MNKLQKACWMAKNSGDRKYLSGGLPSCVIGCLYYLEGGVLENTIKWTKHLKRPKITHVVKHFNPPEFAKYDVKLLQLLQDKWDEGSTNVELERIVNAYKKSV